MMKILEGIDGVEVYQDDIIIHGRDEQQHDARLKHTLDRIRQSGLKLNERKCKFKRNSLSFLGHVIDANGISAHPDKIKAIRDMAAPTSVTELRSFMGMVNFMSRFIENLSRKMEPLNKLLCTDNEWTWGPDQEKAFEDVKAAITTPTVLAYYDQTRPTIVSSDASSYGIGAVLMQEDNQGQRRPVAYISRTMTSSERRYAQIEKELLGVVWACEKFSRYLVGLSSFRILTDHKPLVPIINEKDLDVTPIRCQRLLIRLMRYNGKAEHVPGKTLVLADLLSRKPLDNDEEDDDLEQDVNFLVQAVVANIPATREKIQEIKDASCSDKIVSSAMTMTKNGWPDISEVPPEVRELYQARANLSVADDLLMYGQRVVIPTSLREDMLQRLHNGHMGITKCKLRAQDTVWWPGISNDIQKHIEDCNFCKINKPVQRAETLEPRPMADRPWQWICTDLLQFAGKTYMVVVDEYSKWIEITYLRSTASSMVILELKKIFARWGIPQRITSDNGPQYASREFRIFAAEWGFKHVTSSPYYAQSNGAAENAVKQAKRILKQTDPHLALMEYRATPTTVTGYSPCQLLQGRVMPTTIPRIETKLTPRHPEQADVRRNHDKAREKQAFYFNRRHGAHDLDPLHPGETVRIRTPNESKWGSPARVVKQYGPAEARSYVVDTGEGKFRRNRRHLQRIPPRDVQQHRRMVIPMDDTPEPREEPMVQERVDTPPAPEQPSRPVRSTRGRMPERFKDYVLTK